MKFKKIQGIAKCKLQHYRNDLPIMHTLLHLKVEKCENSIIFARLK